MPDRILTDEQDNAVKQKAEELVARHLEAAERSGQRFDAGTKAVPYDPRKDPNFKKWVNTLGKNPFAGGESPEVEQAQGRFNGTKATVDAFLKSTEFADFMRNKRKASDYFSIGSFESFRGKTAGVTSYSDIAQVAATLYLPDVVQLPTRPTRVRDLMRRVEIEDSSIRYLRQTGYTNSAGTIPVNTDPSSVTAMAQSTITVAMKTVTVIDIAHYIPVPTQLLDDVQGMRDVLETQMEAGVLDQEDAQFLNGGGSGNDQTGITIDSDVQAFSWSAGDANDNQADAILNGLVKAWIAYYAPDGITIHPTNWKQICKLKNTLGDYLFPQAHSRDLPDSLWGKPVVQTVANTLGAPVVGSWKQGATFYDREEASIYIAREHSDWRIKNLLAVICQERALGVFQRPESFVVVTLDGAP